MGMDRTVQVGDYASLETLTKKFVGEKQKFERLHMSKADLLEMFKDNRFKVTFINDKVAETGSTVYRCGPLIDLCLGPHVPDTGRIKAMMITKVCFFALMLK